MAKTAVYFEFGSYTVPAGKHLIVTNHRASTESIRLEHTVVVNNGESRLPVSTFGRLTGAVLPSGTTPLNPSAVKQSISGYLVDN